MACENSLAKGCIDKEAYISSTVDVSHVNMVRSCDFYADQRSCESEQLS